MILHSLKILVSLNPQNTSTMTQRQFVIYWIRLPIIHIHTFSHISELAVIIDLSQITTPESWIQSACSNLLVPICYLLLCYFSHFFPICIFFQSDCFSLFPACFPYLLCPVYFFFIYFQSDICSLLVSYHFPEPSLLYPLCLFFFSSVSSLVFQFFYPSVAWLFQSIFSSSISHLYFSSIFFLTPLGSVCLVLLALFSTGLFLSVSSLSTIFLSVFFICF